MRLAPLYDLASYLPYDKNPKATKLAMKIGGRSYLDEIGAHQWKKWATEVGWSPDGIIGIATVMVEKLIESLEPTRDEIAKNHNVPFLHRLTDLIGQRARLCAEMLA
jgi:serine/threonine-protein kinase HipA